MGLVALSQLLASGADLTPPGLGTLQTNIASQSVAATSNEIYGRITITTGGTGPSAGAAVAIVQFPDTWPGTPTIDCGEMAGHGVSFSVNNIGVSGFTIVAATALVASTTYLIGYQVFV